MADEKEQVSRCSFQAIVAAGGPVAASLLNTACRRDLGRPEEVLTEIKGWLVLAAIVLPGAVITAILDQMIPLDRGQLWTFSIVFSGIVFVSLILVLARNGRADYIILWYPLLVVSLLLAVVLSLGFNVHWVAAFVSRFSFGPELFNPDLWIPTVINLVVTSVIALAGTVVILLARLGLIALTRSQVWGLAFVLNAIAAVALARVGGDRHWFMFTDDPDFPQSRSDQIIVGAMLVVAANMAFTLLACFLYFGFRATVFATLFLRMAPQWPDWLK
jgi:hypothetical protein